jgi:transcriptional antiterminator NusG
VTDDPNHVTDDPTAGAPGLDRDAVLGGAAPVDESHEPASELHEPTGSSQPLDDRRDSGEISRNGGEIENEEVATSETSVAADAGEAPAEKPKAPPLTVKSSPTPAVDLESPGPDPSKRQWYILKVQSNREDSIVEGLQRRVAIADLQDYFGEIIIPIEMVTEFKNGKKRIVKRKLYPGYIMVNMQITDDTWFLVRDTAGIGDFTGSGGKPIPMQAHEVSRLIAKQDEKQEEAPKLKINFKVGDRVKINEGTFENFEGEVNSIDEANGRVVVMINIFGRSTPVELEYWQVESI